MAGLGVITLAVAVVIMALVKDPVRPAGMAEGAGFAGFRDLLRMRVLWPIIPLTALNYAPAAGIRGLWAGPYLADVYGADALLIGRGHAVHGAGDDRRFVSLRSARHDLPHPEMDRPRQAM